MSLIEGFANAANTLRYLLRNAGVDPGAVKVRLELPTKENVFAVEHELIKDASFLNYFAGPTPKIGGFTSGFAGGIKWQIEEYQPEHDGKAFDCSMLIDTLDNLLLLNARLSDAVRAIHRTGARIDDIKIIERTEMTEDKPQQYMIYVRGQRL